MATSREVEETAATWLARRCGDAWSATDDQALDEWLHESTAHRVAFVRLSAAWDATTRLGSLGAGLPPGHVPERNDWERSPFFRPSSPGDAMRAGADTVGELQTEVGEQAESPRVSRSPSTARNPGRARRFSRPRTAVAACVAAALLGVAVVVGIRVPTYQTDVGGVSAIPMPDGSRTTLNTDSSVRIAVSEHERRVYLDRGEAFFEVAKDPGRPFVVHAGTRDVTAVGTKFSVWRDGEIVRIVVSEGRVRVSDRDTSATAGTLLAAGEAAHASRSGVLVETMNASALEESLAWKDGYLVFHDRALADAVAEFNRYNARHIAVRDPVIGAIHIGGRFRSNDAEAFVRLLEAGFPIDAKWTDAEINLERKR